MKRSGARRISVFPWGAYLALCASAYLFVAWTAAGWTFPQDSTPPYADAVLGGPSSVRLPNGDTMVLRSQFSESFFKNNKNVQSIPKNADSGASQRIVAEGANYALEYGFVNFNRDRILLRANEPKANVQDSLREFGFYPKDLKAIDTWYQQAQTQAIDAAKAKFVSGKVTAKTQAEVDRRVSQAERENAEIQSQLDQTLANLKTEYENKRTAFYQKAGFRFTGQHQIETDIPAMVHRNARWIAPVALAFSGIVQSRSYEMEDLVGAVVAMAQTAVRYAEVPISDSTGKNIGGTVVPPQTLIQGHGDCDTKTALIGSILYNWPNLKMVGLAIPDHYLMGIYQVPASGDAYVEYDGLTYVMIEAAGPAWLAPGKVGEYTESYLSSGKLFDIEPF